MYSLNKRYMTNGNFGRYGWRREPYEAREFIDRRYR